MIFNNKKIIKIYVFKLSIKIKINEKISENIFTNEILSKIITENSNKSIIKFHVISMNGF